MNKTTLPSHKTNIGGFHRISTLVLLSGVMLIPTACGQLPISIKKTGDENRAAETAQRQTQPASQISGTSSKNALQTTTIQTPPPKDEFERSKGLVDNRRLFSTPISDPVARIRRIEVALQDLRDDFDTAIPAMAGLVVSESELEQVLEDLRRGGEIKYTDITPPKPKIDEAKKAPSDKTSHKKSEAIKSTPKKPHHPRHHAITKGESAPSSVRPDIHPAPVESAQIPSTPHSHTHRRPHTAPHTRPPIESAPPPRPLHGAQGQYTGQQYKEPYYRQERSPYDSSHHAQAPQNNPSYPANPHKTTPRPQPIETVVRAPKKSYKATSKSTKTAASSGPQVLNVRVGTYPDKTRIVLDMSKPSAYTVDLDNDEKLLVLEIKGAGWQASENYNFKSSALLSDFTAQQEGANGSRLLLSLKQPVKIVKKFALKADGPRKDRIVVDIVAQ